MPIRCEKCQFVGLPATDGTCPVCGSIGGHKAMGLQKPYEPTLQDIEEEWGSADEAYREQQEELYNMMYGG